MLNICKTTAKNCTWYLATSLTKVVRGDEVKKKTEFGQIARAKSPGSPGLNFHTSFDRVKDAVAIWSRQVSAPPVI